MDDFHFQYDRHFPIHSKKQKYFFEPRENLRTGVEKAANYRQVLSGISRPRVQRGEKRYLLSPPDHKALTVQARSRIRGRNLSGQEQRVAHREGNLPGIRRGIQRQH